MTRKFVPFAVLCLALVASGGAAQDYSWSQLNQMDRSLTITHQGLEWHKTDQEAVPDNAGWVFRSNHFVFGMPRIVDQRHDFIPPGDDVQRPGVSVLVREGFVIGHFDRMRVPLFVCQRWTQADYHRMKKRSQQDRNWRVDLELPLYARGEGTSYNYADTDLQRGHMARHADNRAWGEDNSAMGCQMSNSAPQHRNVNMGPGWRELEDAVQSIVSEGDIKVVWTITGTLFRDKENPDDEEAEVDFSAAEYVGDGFGVPKATYKIVGWFDGRGYFQGRGYVFEQTAASPQTDPDPANHLVPIRKIEERAGIDVFPLMKDHIEDIVEKGEHDNMWGS